LFPAKRQGAQLNALGQLIVRSDGASRNNPGEAERACEERRPETIV